MSFLILILLMEDLCQNHANTGSFRVFLKTFYFKANNSSPKKLLHVCSALAEKYFFSVERACFRLEKPALSENYVGNQKKGIIFIEDILVIE